MDVGAADLGSKAHIADNLLADTQCLCNAAVVAVDARVYARLLCAEPHG